MTATPNSMQARTARRPQGARKPLSTRDRWMASRRRDAQAHGYHGPLTREEASRQQLARLAAR